MRKILFFVCLLFSVVGFSQNPTNYQYRTVRERLLAMMVDSSFHVPRYNGTPVGLRVGSSRNSGALGIDTIGHVSFFYSGNKWRNQGSFSFETRIIQGGIVTWDSLLIFSVSPATYYINGAYYTSSLTKLTLDAAHATLDRIDLIYLDSTGAHKETGTAAATPAEPNLPPNSIRLTAIQVPATATSPGGNVDTLIIYDENLEWVGSTTSVTADFDNTVSPFHFIKATSAGAITNLSTVKYTAVAPIDISDYDVLRFRIKLKATFANNTYLRIFFTSTGSNVHVPVELRDGLFGFNRLSLNYQEISIPIAALSFINTSVDGLYFQSSGTNGSGFYLDWIQLFSNITQPPVGNTPNLQQVTDVGSLTTNTIIAPSFRDASSFFSLSVVAGQGRISFSNGTATDHIRPQAASTGSNNRLPFTGNVADTLATLHDVRAGGGGGGGTPGGSDKQVQYNNAGAFGGSAGFETALTNIRTRITAQATTEVPLSIVLAGSQTANAFEVYSSAPALLTSITKDGYGWFPAGSSTANAQGIKIGTSGLFDLSNNLGYYGVSTGFNAFIGGSGLGLKSTTATIDIGQQSTFSTVNQIRMSTVAEGHVKFHSLGLTAPTIINATAGENTAATLRLAADEADDVTDTWDLTSTTAGNLTLTNNSNIRLTLASSGAANLGAYGAGTFTGTPARYLAVEADGDVIEATTSSLKPALNKAVTIEAPSASEAIDMWQTPVAITVTSLKAILRGTTPSVTYNIRFGTDITSATDVFTSNITCTSVTTGCSNSSGFNDATIPAGSFIWVITSAMSGTVNSISLTLNYTED